MKKYFVVGNPIDHSLSPQLHNYWLKKNNINGVYDKKKLDSNDLKDLIFRSGKCSEISFKVSLKPSPVMLLFNGQSLRAKLCISFPIIFSFL